MGGLGGEEERREGRKRTQRLQWNHENERRMFIFSSKMTKERKKGREERKKETMEGCDGLDRSGDRHSLPIRILSVSSLLSFFFHFQFFFVSISLHSHLTLWIRFIIRCGRVRWTETPLQAQQRTVSLAVPPPPPPPLMAPPLHLPHPPLHPAPVPAAAAAAAAPGNGGRPQQLPDLLRSGSDSYC